MHEIRHVTALLAAVLLCLAIGVQCNDFIQVHSLFPPILQNYWSNGMEYWAFGRDTVVTDNYVRLTDGLSGTKGYLWNRHDNRMQEFQLNVTVQVTNMDNRWFQRAQGSGIGIWYVNAEKVNFKSDASFFGFQKKFKGVGVVLDDANELSLVEGMESMNLDASILRDHRLGFCKVPRHDELHMTISLVYAQWNGVNVYYTTHPGEEPDQADFADSKLCVRTNIVAVASSSHFGVTAANVAETRLRHDVHSVIMTPLSEVEEHKREEAAAGIQGRFLD